MQLDPADFMSAAQTSGDRRERKVVLAGKRRLSACLFPERDYGTARQKEVERFIGNAKHCSSSSSRDAGCCSASDGQNENSYRSLITG